jgi:hypothetical protein
MPALMSLETKGNSMAIVTSHHQDLILEAALKDAFGKRLAEMEARTQSLALEVYMANTTPEERKMVAKLAKISPHYLQRKDDRVVLNCGGLSVDLLLKEPVYTCWNYNNRLVIKDDMAKEVREAIFARDKLREERLEAKKKLLQLLKSARTFKQLAALWPEGVKYYEGMDNPVERKGLPAIAVAEVNKALGLPKGAK